MKVAKYFVWLFLCMTACIEPFNAKVPDGERPLVVDGLITDQPGPYQVMLYRSAALNAPTDETEWVIGASVVIVDDEGASDHLTESSAGHYQTSSIQGAIGRTYTLKIQLEDGHQYESIPEKIIPVGDFSNVNYQFKQVLSYQDEDQLSPKNGFDIYLDANLNPEQNGLSRWRYTGTFEFKTYPELRLAVAVPSGPVVHYIPNPPKCSGFIYKRNAASTEQVGECTCCTCWVNQYNQSPLISDKRFVSNNKITHYNVAHIPVNKRYFYDKYYLDIEQMSVSQPVYDFWQKVAKQQQQGSNLFQTPPAMTTGNIKSMTEGGLPAIGLFGASAVMKHSFILYPTDVPYKVDRLDTIAESCLTVYQYSSATKPSFW